MKKIAWLLGIFVCGGFLYFFLRTQGNHSIGSADVFWTDRDIEGFKIDPHTELRVVAETIYQKPAFYEGTMPLECKAYVEEIIPPQVSGGVHSGIVVLEQYSGFKNMYVYGNDFDAKLRGIPVGAVTMSDSGDLLAEAKLVKTASGGIEIEEQHYGGCSGGTCSLSFRVTSSIDESGFKKAEDNPLGQRVKDYYFRWPTGLF